MTRSVRNAVSSIPAGIWVLGLVSMFMDISSEMIHSILPMFLVTSLHVSAFMVGVIEGLAESTALIVKVFSGVLSDHWANRKRLVLFGYGLGALTKPIFATAPSGCRFGGEIGRSRRKRHPRRTA
jgi:hypothetical protein